MSTHIPDSPELPNAQPWENACIRLAGHVGDLIRALGEAAPDRPDRVRAALNALDGEVHIALHLIPRRIFETGA
jgi:hypothetical protein